MRVRIQEKCYKFGKEASVWKMWCPLLSVSTKSSLQLVRVGFT